MEHGDIRSISPSEGELEQVTEDIVGKRAYRKRLAHDWTHEDTLKLIELWGNEESTYNKRCAAYRDKSERSNAYKRIRLALEEYGISVSTEEVFTKMHSLRVYYSATNNKAKAARQKSGTDEDIHVTWPYYEKLSFLKNNMNPRGPSTTTDGELDDSSQFEPTQVKRARPSFPMYVMEPVSTVPSASYVTNGGLPSSVADTREQWSRVEDDTENTDDLFCRMLAIQLRGLPEQTREIIKHEISGLLLKARYPNYKSLHSGKPSLHNSH